MQRDEVIARLKQHRAQFKALGVLPMYLFGSVTRDDAREDTWSDSGSS